jgi:DNA-binding LytR/AlgR family response regulator
LKAGIIQFAGFYVFVFVVFELAHYCQTKNMRNIQNPEGNVSHPAMPAMLALQGGQYAARTETDRPMKQSFLVFKNNRYLTVATENIALFQIRYDSPIIICFDRQEYFVNYSLEQIQQLLSPLQFYRVNRQCLVNFKAIREVEHYFARKLLVKLSVTISEKLIVSKEKATSFLGWMENR